MPLSTRAKSAENASDGLHIWKAVDDLFHPTANPTGFATLGVSENTLMSRKLSEHLHRNFKLPSHSLTYGDGMTGSKRIKAALAIFLNRHLHPSKPLESAAAEGQRVAGLIISNPHNPLRRCYSRASLLSLMRFCSENDMHFISDEVYALSVWENKVDQEPEPALFESCLSLNTDGVLAPDRIHTIWGMSKDFGANGLRIGAVISQSNPALHKALVAVALYSSPSSASDHIAVNILEDEKWSDSFIQENRTRLASRYQLIVRWANSYGIPYAPGTNAAFFLWADLGSVWKRHNPGTVTDKELDDFLIKLFLDHKVYVSSGKDFGSERAGWFRMVFSQDEVQLLTGLERVAAALKSRVTVNV
ncbi:1-aminocyclopropane-1-carboxylate synthase-like protein 1 [Colletotrichum tropicale]|nr:1-aminocyclopropane-1-carboxylate synthase-like protein 1 [Colletotrichum tropicale]